jgi:uncharacterized metal-binding protein
MPSGRVHLRIEALLLLLWLAAGGWLVQAGRLPVEALVAFGAGYVLSMLLLSPDLDLATSRAFKRWGIFRVLWWPYAKLFRHRHASHHWFWGTATRLLYLSVLVLLVVGAVLIALGARVQVARLPRWPILAGAAAGLYAPNLTHILADGLSTLARRARLRRL